ncbi:hypothetical protein CSUB01_01768 [Colletotrichum sublineola]|uniref:Uncharacterized protein n=1 Tax=Colletotrichum sublineola TaxID=1173701 RepID=A0A066XC11_COLSU|nr:hypothetical protein CSUB01_01768 [Colletotrichum sublineola]
MTPGVVSGNQKEGTLLAIISQGCLCPVTLFQPDRNRWGALAKQQYPGRSRAEANKQPSLEVRLSRPEGSLPTTIVGACRGRIEDLVNLDWTYWSHPASAPAPAPASRAVSTLAQSIPRHPVSIAQAIIVELSSMSPYFYELGTEEGKDGPEGSE